MSGGFGRTKRRIAEGKRQRREEKRRKRQNKGVLPPSATLEGQPLDPNAPTEQPSEFPQDTTILPN